MPVALTLIIINLQYPQYWWD